MLNTHFQNNKRTNNYTFGSKKLKLKKRTFGGLIGSDSYQKYLISRLYVAFLNSEPKVLPTFAKTKISDVSIFTTLSRVAPQILT